MVDKYGTGTDPDCYPNSETLKNLLNIKDAQRLAQAERGITELSATEIDFTHPPYNLQYLQTIHRTLFQDIYSWAGQLRHIDVAKGNTRFCNWTRVQPEADKLFDGLAKQQYFVELGRASLIGALAELYGELNVVHPFREAMSQLSVAIHG